MTVPHVRQRFQVVLPKRVLDAETAIALIQYLQEQNDAAYRSHRQQTTRRRDGL